MSDDDRRAKIVKGFKINYMNIKDDETRKTMWESKSWDKTFEEELKIEVPKEILSLKAVSRELNFSSKELIKDFRIVQSVSLMGNPLEVWSFKFGFVIPDSTNSWENIIEAAGEGQMLSASVLSGNIVIETAFYDGDFLVCKSKMKL